MTSAIVVQCFIKNDTLVDLCDSLLKCEGKEDFHLIFWSDAVRPGEKYEARKAKNDNVLLYLLKFQNANSNLFASIEIKINTENEGTCKTCQTALNYAFERYDFVVFTEDDTIFSKDALRWGLMLRRQGLLDDDKIIAFAGESIYFDARRNNVEAKFIDTAREQAIERNLAKKYVKLNFLPSTCFFTTREKWALFGPTRGAPRGDEDVCEMCKKDGLYCVFPVVARVKDVGMLHADGYSVNIHGVANVAEVKNTYLLSDDLPDTDDIPELFDGNMGALFEESVKLLRFDGPEAIREVTIASPRKWKLWCFSLKNFGDALTPWILSRCNVPFELVDDMAEANLLGIGSNLDRVRHDNSPIAIWSSGFMYPKQMKVSYGKNVKFIGLRGKLTRSLVEAEGSLDCPLGDGGLMVRTLFPFRDVQKKYEIGIIPHMSDVAAAKQLGMDQWEGTKLIDVFAPIAQVLGEIAACRRIASSSLHGLIAADAFEIPNCQVVFGAGRELEGGGFKYDDYSSALGYNIFRVTIQNRVSMAYLLSEIDRIDQNSKALEFCLEGLTASLNILSNPIAVL